MTKDLPQFGPEELQVLLRELRNTLERGVDGDVVEMGCYKGDTSLQMARFLSRLSPDKKLHVYDSFEGLPGKSAEDNSPAGTDFTFGELRATKKEVAQKLARAGFDDVRIKKGWFGDLAADDLPDKVCFAFLDGDFYDSINDSLKLVWPKLSPGAMVIVDDYANEALPGAARATDRWLRSHPAKFTVEKSLGIIKV